MACSGPLPQLAPQEARYNQEPRHLFNNALLLDKDYFIAIGDNVWRSGPLRPHHNWQFFVDDGLDIDDKSPVRESDIFQAIELLAHTIAVQVVLPDESGWPAARLPLS